MAAQSVRSRNGEESPLLGKRRSVGSTETLTDLTSVNTDVENGDADGREHLGIGRGLLIALSLGSLIFLQSSNMSLITTTQSKIAEDLDAYSQASWFTSVYLIAMSSFAPIAARLSLIFAPKSCMLFASLLFAIGGITTSFAYSFPVFLLGRAISGSGAAGIFTISFVIVLELASKKRRGLFIGLVNTGFTIGVSLGAVVAGALLPVMGWRFLFWAQSPFGVIAGAGIFFSIPTRSKIGAKDGREGSVLAKLARIDYMGAFALMASLIAFLLGLSLPKVYWEPILASVILLLIFVYTELYLAADPIIPVVVLKSRGTLLACLAQLGMMSARWMVLFYSPVYAIAVRGWEPAAAGAMLIPTNLGFATSGLLVGGLHIRRAGSFWTACVTSIAVFSCTLFYLSWITTPTTPAIMFILGIFCNGFFTGAAINYTLAHILHLTPPSTHFVSTALLNTFRGFAGSFGSAIGGGLFLRVLHAHLQADLPPSHDREDLIRRLLGSPSLVSTLPTAARTVAVAAYAHGLSGLFLAGSGVALVVMFIQGSAGWKAPGEIEEESMVIPEEEWEEGVEQAL